MQEYWASFSQQMKPKLHELSAYLIAFTCCWLILSQIQLRQNTLFIFSGFGSLSPYFVGVGLVVLWGMGLSIFHVFVERKKSDSEKYFIGWFTMGISGIASFAAGVEMLNSRAPVLAILPAWNIVMSMLLFTQMAFQKYELADEEATSNEVFISTLGLVSILVISDLLLRFSWAGTLSLCIFYATTVIFVARQVLARFGKVQNTGTM